MITLLHFADAHIDMVSQGRHDALSGLPLRSLDFLKALDTIIQTAIERKVDLVLFAGDAYKDRTPSPTFQREWGRRIMALSRAGIPSLLLIGNHDVSPAAGRANTLQEYDTLDVPNVRVISRPCLLGPSELWGLPLQVLGLPWVSRSALLAAQPDEEAVVEDVNDAIAERLGHVINRFLEKADPSLPLVLTAHASIQGAVYGGERSVMLGSDVVLPPSLVRDPRIRYTALGHIHKAQDLNEGRQPPVIYPGSIERVDFGEAADEKFCVIASVDAKADTKVEWVKLEGRRFVDRTLRLDEGTNLPSPALLEQHILAALPPLAELDGAMVRLILEYPREMDALLDETSLRARLTNAFEFHFIRRPQVEARLRLPRDQSIGSLAPLDLLNLYWKTMNTASEETSILQTLAQQVIARAVDADLGEE